MSLVIEKGCFGMIRRGRVGLSFGVGLSFPE